ncbi:MAG: low molecular weight phosphotyrosine protein phosphatase [Bacteroidetes bacterium]|nr:low molecular weight phosphotyrosine protein phosphatase [Bacteroidota bacterium]
MTKILMVCLGNICRSPLAEGILKSKLPENIFFVDSAGTANYHIGRQPDHRSIETAKKYGVDITNQRGRQFVVSDFDDFDYIYAMDSTNFNDIISLSRNINDASKIKLILDELTDVDTADVPDPYYGGSQGFENVYRILDSACNIIANKLK